jgi:hypothetical protein
MDCSARQPPGEASQFSEPTLNDAIPASGSAAGRENSRRRNASCPVDQPFHDQ